MRHGCHQKSIQTKSPRRARRTRGAPARRVCTPSTGFVESSPPSPTRYGRAEVWRRRVVSRLSSEPLNGNVSCGRTMNNSWDFRTAVFAALCATSLACGVATTMKRNEKKECERRTSFQSLAIFFVAGDRFSLREQVPRVESDSSQREWNDDDDVS